MTKASTPQPPPIDEGIDVGASLEATLTRLYLFGADASTAPTIHDALELVQERRAFGLAKYGQPLRTEDGRDGIEDLRQELGDALMYTHKLYLTDRLTAEQHKALILHLITTLSIIPKVTT